MAKFNLNCQSSMKLQSPSRTLPDGSIEPAHAVEIFCGACGYDLDQSEIDADTCADCGQPLNLQQSVAIQITTVPAASGATM
jgi:hypothetical protein